MPFLEPVSLQGTLVRLDPLEVADERGLSAASADGEIWRLGYTSVPRPGADMAADIAFRLGQFELGTMLPFTVRRLDTGAVIGATTFCHVDAANRHVEIGYTWNARSAQRSGTNTDSKLQLLTHAFDVLDCIAVEFRTHWLNQQSQRAIERLGARRDGVLRSHKIMADGTLRDTVVYSITAAEWPAIRNDLARRLTRT